MEINDPLPLYFALHFTWLNLNSLPGKVVITALALVSKLIVAVHNN
jgi:hypothetical protein